MGTALLTGKPARFLKAHGSRDRAATRILPAPISIPEKDAVSFLINKKDSPQAIDRTIRMINDWFL